MGSQRVRHNWATSLSLSNSSKTSDKKSENAFRMKWQKKKYYTLILVGYISCKALSTNVRKEDKVQT